MKTNQFHKYKISLKIALKSIFIIAIVAVAMIGVMIPSGFSAYDPCNDPNLSDHPACSKELLQNIDVSNYFINTNYL